MRIVCINADEGFKAFIETIIPKSYQVIYMILNEDNAHKLSQTDIKIYIGITIEKRLWV